MLVYGSTVNSIDQVAIRRSLTRPKIKLPVTPVRYGDAASGKRASPRIRLFSARNLLLDPPMDVVRSLEAPAGDVINRKEPSSDAAVASTLETAVDNFVLLMELERSVVKKLVLLKSVLPLDGLTELVK